MPYLIFALYITAMIIIVPLIARKPIAEDAVPPDENIKLDEYESFWTESNKN